MVFQYNVHASDEYRHHEVTWEADSNNNMTSAWVRLVRPGDTLRVTPKAQFAGWINHVREAEIEVHGIQKSPDTVPSYLPRLVETGDAAGASSSCYRPLNQSVGEIRLVLLQPGLSEEPLSCTLIHTSLYKCSVSYEALSYCWGDPRNRENIVVRVHNGGQPSELTMSITSNLYSALRTLRTQTGPPRTIWIDAISINQADLDERSSQVRLMTMTFMNASRVIVWLGEGNSVTKSAIQTIRAINDRHFKTKAWELADLHHPLMEAELGVDEFVDDLALFESPWFRRTWVVQEVFNARGIVVHCGEDTLDWPALLRVNKCIRLTDLKMNSSYKAQLPPIYQDIFDSLSSRVWRDSFTGSSTELGILEILIKGLDLDAEDPRDKIFAMLQFDQETADLGSLPAEIVPDYRKAAPEVFGNFTRWWIMHHRSLRILSAIQALDGRSWLSTTFPGKRWVAPGFPSWSWSYRGHSNWALGLLGLDHKRNYRACGDTQLDMNLLTTSRYSPLLPLLGIRIDLISSIGPYPYFKPWEHSEAIHRTYVGIFDPLNLTGKWVYQLGSKNHETYTTNDSPDLWESHFAVHDEYAAETGAVGCHNHCLFRTQEKGLTGLCPAGARVGDLVVILYGGSVPYVVREQKHDTGTEGEETRERETRYEFVGECFLEEYMGGRGIDEQKRQGLPNEVFTLV
ncbi:uncharacterized protein Z520_10969 [Fonsecaea multimorphosa CBS 102226]|uniref:Heterokaryon incompatibility domain-containing protein n=1 Tax=Fonsecaea multimorphosa CBS 102226 TaxID=1442371 RepID=A0A0D2I811_9EURO|nr:uncharacterized protein Z520_10969 [Fonsecaea multimorphosa CBS 102226]KIX93326.1 hypothetical protein Z520_10969 [Fonsecaea multimorphosa CBS 102226]OAL18564.1 hypothetical protein AYO22_10541 [Fonsecaea multimorphosa]